MKTIQEYLELPYGAEYFYGGEWHRLQSVTAGCEQRYATLADAQEDIRVSQIPGVTGMPMRAVEGPALR
jgi:hypothetical protein